MEKLWPVFGLVAVIAVRGNNSLQMDRQTLKAFDNKNLNVCVTVWLFSVILRLPIFVAYGPMFRWSHMGKDGTQKQLIEVWKTHLVGYNIQQTLPPTFQISGLGMHKFLGNAQLCPSCGQKCPFFMRPKGKILDNFIFIFLIFFIFYIFFIFLMDLRDLNNLNDFNNLNNPNDLNDLNNLNNLKTSTT